MCADTSFHTACPAGFEARAYSYFFDGMNYQILGDDMLWKLVKVSDERAFTEVYRRHWRGVFEAAYYRVRSKEVAKELVQSLFLRLWERREATTIEHLGAYLQRSIKNSILNYIESRMVEARYRETALATGEGAADDADTTLLLHELNRAVERALCLLPSRTQEVFRLSRYENRSAREIAAQMNLSEKAVEYHITKSLKLLRLHLKDFIFLLALSQGLL